MLEILLVLTGIVLFIVAMPIIFVVGMILWMVGVFVVLWVIGIPIQIKQDERVVGHLRYFTFTPLVK